MRLGTYRMLLAAGALGVIGLARADDRIEYQDPKNRANVLVANGTIQDEGYGTIKFKQSAGGTEVTIPVADVVKINYDLPGAAKLEYGGIAAAEEKQDYPKALDGYKSLLSKVAGNERAKRFVEYKIASLSAAAAADKPETIPAAVEALKKFVEANPGTWQTAVAYRQLIGLQLKARDNSGALASAEAWIANDKLPRESKSEAELARVDVLLQTGKAAEAMSKIEGLSRSLPAGDPMKARLDIYALAGSGIDKADNLGDLYKKFDDLIGKSSDPSYKAAAYNALGLCNRIKGRPREAMWNYIWVDTVYNQDRAEHVKALENLIRLFEEADGMKDPEKAKLYREKLARIRQ